MPARPEVSIVVPLLDEAPNVEPLVAAVRMALGDGAWELLLVDDGSADDTAERAERAAREDARIRPLRLARNYGQTMAIQAGLDHARGRVVVTMDGDLQNDPADIPKLVKKIEEGYDLVTGYRASRQDSFLTRKVPSWIANGLIRALTGVPVRDTGCSLKAYRAEIVRGLHLYSDLHRFIPAVVAGTASLRIAEVPVRHHPRRQGQSKYGLSRVWKVLADLLVVTMIRWFRERPLAMFGLAAAAVMVVGTVFAAGAAVAAATFQPLKAEALVLPAATLLWFGLAAYLVALGFVAEVGLRGAYREGETPVTERGAEG